MSSLVGIHGIQYTAAVAMEEAVILRQRTQPLLIPAVYLLKTDYKKEKQRCYNRTNCSCSVLFEVSGQTNVKDQSSGAALTCRV